MPILEESCQTTVIDTQFTSQVSVTSAIRQIAPACNGTAQTQATGRHGLPQCGLSGNILLQLAEMQHICSSPARTNMATDPRDIVFALINITRNAESLGVVPDYTKSTVEVFTPGKATHK